jgi:hypothetical protein
MATSGSATPSNALMCGDTILTGGVLTDGGGAAVVEQFDDAGNVIDSGTANLTGGGIWNPPAMHVLNQNPTTQTTVTGASSSTYTISGLKNFSPYTVVVAAVDGSGTVGPPSQQACATPAPVNDFFKIYRESNGQAGGGFCALEAVGAPASSTVAFAGLGAVIVAQIRRRRSRRSRSK